MQLQDTLLELIQTAIKTQGWTVAKLQLEHPSTASYGDYSTNAAMLIFAQQKTAAVPLTQKNPREVALTLIETIKDVQAKNPEKYSQVQEVSLAGPGFINFRLTSSSLIDQLQQSVGQQEVRVTQSHPGKKVVVEYSSPNIAKPFTVGHLRSTIIGDAVANLLHAAGWQVFRDNHLGDWGTQFGKQIYAMKAWGDEAELDQAERPVKKLVELYVKFHTEAEQHPELEDEARKWFKRLEDGDKEARRLWQKCIDWSLKEFALIYQKLGVHFTENNGRGYGESFFEDKMDVVIEELEKKDVLKSSDGAKLVFLDDVKLPPLMIIKKDGATLYATRDLATDKFRLGHYGSDVVVVNEVGGEQTEYFRQLYAVEALLGWYQPGQRIHVGHGMFRFADQKMSTRKGNVIWLEDVLKEAEDRAAKLLKEPEMANAAEVATAVGIGALKWNDLKRSAHLDVVFVWDEILSMEGNSGPYMQYTYARSLAVLRKAAAQGLKIVASTDLRNYQPNEEELAVLRQFYQFDEVVQRAAQEFAPHHLCTYLFGFAQTFNSFYNTCQILNATEPQAREFRLLLTDGVRLVIEKGLKTLGIQTIEKM